MQDNCYNQTPRNQFNERLGNRYWDLPTAIPSAVPYNTPVGTHLCDRRPFICHPQKYGKYPNVPVESVLLNLDYYNLYDTPESCEAPTQSLSPEMIQKYYTPNRICPLGPKVFRNNTKLWKYRPNH